MDTQHALEETKVSVQLKLAALWTSLMFFVIYIDYFALYMPGTLKNISAGKVFVFDLNQGFLVGALTVVSIPALMISLSVALPAKVNRWVNIIIAAINIPLIFNLAGHAWIHMIVGAAIEVVLLGLIINYAWKWPRTK